jgi:hypothetical protein
MQSTRSPVIRRHLLDIPSVAAICRFASESTARATKQTTIQSPSAALERGIKILLDKKSRELFLCACELIASGASDVTFFELLSFSDYVCTTPVRPLIVEGRKMFSAFKQACRTKEGKRLGELVGVPLIVSDSIAISTISTPTCARIATTGSTCCPRGRRPLRPPDRPRGGSLQEDRPHPRKPRPLRGRRVLRCHTGGHPWSPSLNSKSGSGFTSSSWSGP